MPSILLVADDTWVRNDVAATLTDPDTTLETLDQPEEAAALLGQRWYDAVIIDMQVGNMGGMAIVHHLRDAMAAGNVEDTPLLLLLDRQADAFLARRAGVDAYLVKPFTAQELRATLAGVQARKTAPEDAPEPV